MLDEASATSLFFAPDAGCSCQNRGPVSHRELPDFGIGDIQLQVHKVSLPTLVQLAVLRNLCQERVLGIERSGRKDKDPLGYSPAGSQCCLYPGMFLLPPEHTPMI